MTTTTYIFPTNTQGYADHKNFRLLKSDDDIGEICDDGELIADYQFENGCHKMSAEMWYSSEGHFEMVVNHVDRDTALRMFALAANEAHRAETTSQVVKPKIGTFRVVIIYTDGWELHNRRFKSKEKAFSWTDRQGYNKSDYMIVEDKNANTKYIRAMLYGN